MHAKFTKASLFRSKPVNAPMDPNVQMKGVDGPDFVDARRYISFRKLIYFITCPDITSIMSVVNQYMKSPKQVY